MTLYKRCITINVNVQISNPHTDPRSKLVNSNGTGRTKIDRSTQAPLIDRHRHVVPGERMRRIGGANVFRTSEMTEVSEVGRLSCVSVCQSGLGVLDRGSLF